MATHKGMKRKAEGDTRPVVKQKVLKRHPKLNEQLEVSSKIKNKTDHIKEKNKKKLHNKLEVVSASVKDVTPSTGDNRQTVVSNKNKRKKLKKKSPSKDLQNKSNQGQESKIDTSKLKTADDFLSERDKKRLTIRQKHKILKLKMKKKAKHDKKGPKRTTTKPTETQSTCERVQFPKTPKDISSNWKQLQATLNQPSNGKPQNKKYKPKNIRNPKLLKTTQDKDENSSKTDKQENSAPEIWFDDVDEIFLEKKPVFTPSAKSDDGPEDTAAEQNPLVKPDAFKGLTKVVGLDCEMVGVGDGTENMLARVSMVNQYGEQIYDEFVKPREKVVDYRTHVSGVRPEHLKKGIKFEDMQNEIASMLNGKILVGHAIRNDLQVLYLSHPKKMIRDTQRYKPFRQLFGGKNPSLKKLSEKVLGVKVQEGEHNSVQDAQATMRLYTMHRQKWEAELKEKRRNVRGKEKKKKVEPAV